MARTRDPSTEALARVEGEGAMQVRIRDGRVERRASCGSTSRRASSRRSCAGALHRGPRHHRADLRHLPGRLPDELDRGDGGRLRRRGRRPIRALRRLLYCGEWIESHALHVFMLHAPDFLGYAARFEMARDHREVVEGALRLKKTGNELHARRRRARDPSDQRPRRRLLPRAARSRARRGGAEQLERAREFAREAVASPRRCRSRTSRRTTCSSRCASRTATRSRAGAWSRAPGSTSRPASTRSTSSRSTSSTRPRCTRACATAAPTSSVRWPATRSTATRCRRLAREAADAAGLGPVCRNPFRSIVVRAVEILYALDEALRLIEAYEPPDAAGRRGRPARRRRVRLDRGAARPALAPLRDRRRRHDPRARIVPPTSQNQGRIEQGLHGFVRAARGAADDELRCAASRRSAATTRASRARRTS